MIYISCFDISQVNSDVYAKLYLAASPERKAKADRYRQSEDAVRCVAADALLRYAVLQRYGPALEFTVGHNPYGKPYITNIDGFYYNISHSGRWVVIGYGDCEIGIDVEKINIDARKELIARRYFTEVEQNYIFSAADDQGQTQRFFQVWTAKESYIKYLGTGLATSLNSFSVIPSGKTLGVHWQSIFLKGGYCLTTCCTEQNSEIQMLTSDQLIP